MGPLEIKIAVPVIYLINTKTDQIPAPKLHTDVSGVFQILLLLKPFFSIHCTKNEVLHLEFLQ